MTDKTQPTTHAQITAPISADMRRIEQSAARAANRDTHFYLAGWNGARGNQDSHEHFRQALQAAPTAPAPVPVLYVSPAQLEKHLDLEGAENAEAGRYLPARKTLAGKFTQPLYALAAAPAQPVARIDSPVRRDGPLWRAEETLTHPLAQFSDLYAGPAQEHATQLAGQGQAYSIDADPEGIRARVAEAITGALASGVKKSDRPSHEHWLMPFWMHAYFGVAQYNALRDSAEAMLNAPGALTQAARDVLAERARQVDAEGFNHARDDKYVGLQLAGAAASYLILAAGGREDDARAFWPWQQEWLKPSEQRRYLEKAGALVLAELERLDRASARAAQGGA